MISTLPTTMLIYVYKRRESRSYEVRFNFHNIQNPCNLWPEIKKSRNQDQIECSICRMEYKNIGAANEKKSNTSEVKKGIRTWDVKWKGSKKVGTQGLPRLPVGTYYTWQTDWQSLIAWGACPKYTLKSLEPNWLLYCYYQKAFRHNPTINCSQSALPSCFPLAGCHLRNSCHRVISSLKPQKVVALDLLW